MAWLILNGDILGIPANVSVFLASIFAEGNGHKNFIKGTPTLTLWVRAGVVYIEPLEVVGRSNMSFGVILTFKWNINCK